MSISSALSNAVSGLAAASKRAEVVSDNVANALTEGYSRREATLSPRMAGAAGAGVAVDGVVRNTDPRATADRRRADSAAAEAGARAEALARLSRAAGEPGEAGALATRAGDLANAIGRLAETPESEPLQAGAVRAAAALSRSLVEASAETQRVRMDADAAIGRMVGEANEALAAVEDLNARIQAETIGGRSVAALEDERARWLDRLAEIVPVRTAPRGEGRLALYSPGGAILLDGRAATLSFDRTETITPDMTLASGALSGLRIDGRPVAAGTGDGAVDGAALGAQFAVRDRAAPEMSAQLDSLAAELIRRFEAPAADPTLTPGDAGLFTDAGLPFDPADQVGLAGRIAVNAAVDPAAGGEVWRMRDGMMAAAPGPAGEDDVPRGMIAALDAASPAPAGTGLSGRYGFAGLVEAVSAGGLRAEADAAASAAYAEGMLSTLAEAEAAATGVDGDREMSDLLAIEKAYAANARVMETVDGLLRRLLEIR